jgi:hypothetical protein
MTALAVSGSVCGVAGPGGRADVGLRCGLPAWLWAGEGERGVVGGVEGLEVREAVG